jgi:phosphoribosyl-dephospho-CoA transferase
VRGVFALFFIPMKRVWITVVSTTSGSEVLWVVNMPRKMLKNKQQQLAFSQGLQALLVVEKG